MYKIAVLGDRDSVLGFRALGLDVVFAGDSTVAHQELQRLIKEDYTIIYLTEQLAVELQADINKYKDDVTPAIILIPGKGGSLGLAKANLKSSVERAVGADIL